MPSVDKFLAGLDDPLAEKQEVAVRHILYRLIQRKDVENMPKGEAKVEAEKHLLEHPLNLIITGPAGSGKSEVIKAVREYFELADSVGKAMYACPYASAAANIGSGASTVHTALGWGLSMTVGGKIPPAVRQRWSSVDFFVIDEFGVMKSNMLGKVSKRLQKIKANDDVQFGGVDVVLVGDFDQLEPVGFGSLKEWRRLLKSPFEDEEHGAWVYGHKFDKVVVLDKVEGDKGRQKGDAEFVNVLTDISRGECTEKDISLINSFHTRNLRLPEWLKSIVITVDNATKDAINWCRVRGHSRHKGRPILMAYPEGIDWHTVRRRDKKKQLRRNILHDYLDGDGIRDVAHHYINNLSTDDFRHKIMPRGLPLMRGMPVMVTHNNTEYGGTELGVANGSTGAVYSIILHPVDKAALDAMTNADLDNCNSGYHLQHPPLCILVKLDTPYRCDKFDKMHSMGLPKGTVPIFPMEHTTTIDIGKLWLKNHNNCPNGSNCTVPGHKVTPNGYHEYLDVHDDRSYHCISVSLQQFPLMPAYAMTDYKAQGRSMGHIIVDLDLPARIKKGNLAKMYVMLSRATSRAKVCIVNRVNAICPRKLQHLSRARAAKRDKTACRCVRCVLTGGRTREEKDEFARLRHVSEQQTSSHPQMTRWRDDMHCFHPTNGN